MQIPQALSKFDQFTALTQTRSTTSSTSYSSKLVAMTSSKKKKSSTSLHVSRPQVSRVRTVRLRQNDSSRSRTGASTSYLPIPVLSSEQPAAIPLATQLESTDALLAEQMNRSDMLAEHYDSTDDLDASKGPKQRTRAKVMSEWLIDRQAYLYEMLRHDGRGELEATSCTGCSGDGSFSCSDCAYCTSYCRQCLITSHRLMPFHRIKVP